MTARKSQLYGSLFFILQNEPKVVALLARQLSIAEIDGAYYYVLAMALLLTVGGGRLPANDHVYALWAL